MAKDYANRFYKSKAWRDCRNGYMQNIGGLCERCIKRGEYNLAVIVHHKIYLDEIKINNPAVALSWENLEALCMDCHNKEHKLQRRYFFNDKGEVVK